MCGRYYIDDQTAREIECLVHQVDERLKQERMGRDIHPSDTAPVLTGSAGAVSRSLQLTWQRWGFPGKKIIFNARSETVLEKRMFSEGILHHRIVIPGTWFYEWNRNKEKATFQRNDSSVLFMAGFSSIFGEEERFVILTTPANESMIATHDRMPLILEQEELETWIWDEETARKLLTRKPAPLKKWIEYEQQSFDF